VLAEHFQLLVRGITNKLGMFLASGYSFPQPSPLMVTIDPLETQLGLMISFLSLHVAGLHDNGWVAGQLQPSKRFYR
jgi:hypothetical protein